MSQRFLPEITLAEINALARSWIPESNRVVSVTAPERAGLALPTPASLAAVIATASKTTLSAYVDRVNAQPLLAPLPTPGTVVRASTREAIGVTEWQLSNGLRVILKPTSYKEDEILFRAVSPGGTSLASDQDLVAAETAEQVVAAGRAGAVLESRLEQGAGRSVDGCPGRHRRSRGGACAAARRERTSRRCFN